MNETCHLCPKQFKSSRGLKVHLERTHGNNPTRAWNKGYRRVPIEQILVKGRPKPGNLRDLLIAIGREYVCEKCRQPPVHNGEPLTLPVDHRDGDNTNQEPSNLRFLCPNCHSQTPTFGWKNRRSHGRKKCITGEKPVKQVDQAV